MTTLDLGAIRLALKAAVETIPDCRAYDTVPASPATGATVAVWVAPPDGEWVAYHETFTGPGGALADVQMRLVPFISMAYPQGAQQRLDDLLSSGTGQNRSLVDAVEADATLGGVVEHCFCTMASATRVYTIGEATYLACDLELSIKVRRG